MIPLALPKAKNVTKMWDTIQSKKTFLERVKESMGKYGGLNLESADNDKILKMIFIGGSWTVIKSKVQKKNEKWDRKGLQDLLVMVRRCM